MMLPDLREVAVHRSTTGSVHYDCVRLDQRLCLPAPATVVRGHRTERPSSLHRTGTHRVFEILHREVLDQLGGSGELDYSAAILDAASIRAKREIFDRSQSGRPRREGSKIHVPSEAEGILLVALSGPPSIGIQDAISEPVMPPTRGNERVHKTFGTGRHKVGSRPELRVTAWRRVATKPRERSTR